MLLMSIFIMGFSFFTSIIVIKYRDLQKIWAVIIQLIFFASAIFYPITIIPEEYRNLFFLNPVALMIHQVRQILIDNEVPNFLYFSIAAIASIIIFICGYFYFKRNVKKVAEYF